MNLDFLEKKTLNSNLVKHRYSFDCDAIFCCESILKIDDFRCTRIKISEFVDIDINKDTFVIYNEGTAIEVLKSNNILLDKVQVYRLRGIYQGHLADFIVDFKDSILSIISEESIVVESLVQYLDSIV